MKLPSPGCERAHLSSRDGGEGIQAARWDVGRLGRADQIHRTGCSDPIHLTGWTLTKDRTSGETLHHYSTATEPGGRLRLACGNRRASRCPSCAWIYAGDTYRLIRAGLAGDDRRDIPATVRDHPRVFTTLTAPSFGPVHNRPDRGICRCGTQHRTDPALGTALAPETYDYAAPSTSMR